MISRNGCTVLVATLAMMPLIACGSADSGRTSAAPPNGRIVVQREWIPNAENAGEALAIGYAAERGLELKVVPGSATTSSVDEVRSGRADIGVASADQVILAIAEGAPLAVIAAALTESPVVWMSRPSLPIRSPAEIRGKRIGVQVGTNTELVTKWMLRSAQIPEADVTMRDLGWGAYEDLLRTSGQLDAVAAFAYDEPVYLSEKAGLTPASFSAKDAGLNLLGTVYFTRQGYADSASADLSVFFQSLALGWRDALREPQVAIASVAELGADESFDQAKELASLRAGARFFVADTLRPFEVDSARWKNTIRMVEQLRGAAVQNPNRMLQQGALRAAWTALEKK